MTARIPLLLLGSLAALLVAPWLGAPLDGPAADFVLWELRVPRVLLGALVGAALALTGAAFQAVLENPLATPSTVGTTAGATVGALAALVLGAGGAWVGAGALLGALGVTALVVALALIRRLRVEDLLIAGIAVSLGASALATGLQLQADAATTFAAVRWSLGSVATVGHDDALRLLPPVLLGTIGILSQTRALQALVAGSDRAASQGVDVVRVRTLVLGLGSLVVAACVATCGPIAFVGLVVPHLVRLAVGGGPRRLVPLSAVVGAGFLPLADGLARIAWPGRELPVGVLTAALGAPTLLLLLLRRR
ncbi:MAG: iron ABC transporter permease [Alphaproteobacteria bacterium]|nr:iron ABC transporter permease [Alphaproteobacteria bacterium]